MQGAKGGVESGDASEPELLRELLTVHEVAQRLTLAPKTVRQLCLSRRLSAVRLSRTWRIPAAALEQFLRERLIRRV